MRTCLISAILFTLTLSANAEIPYFAAVRGNGPTGCCRNLSQIGKACFMYSLDHNEVSPTSFNQITNIMPDPKTFICPDSGNKAGPLSLVDQWTDYILVTNISPTSSNDLILAYCKPENHKNIGCYTMGKDGRVMSSSSCSTHERIVHFNTNGIVTHTTYDFYFD